MLKLWEVRQNNRRVASYYAKNEKTAIQRHKDDQMSQASAFRKSMALRPNEFDGLTAVEIVSSNQTQKGW
jgi:hypothetical protein